MPDPIISRLFGGAGNQLFQYAAGRALADHLGTDLVLDTRYVGKGGDRGDCFDHFTNARFTRDAHLPPAKSDGMLRYSLWRFLGLQPHIYREAALGFDKEFFQTGPGTYLHGYWQSQKYFEPIMGHIQQDLRFTSPLDAENAEMAACIDAAGTSVALHVRRGDYVASGSYAACSPEYYRAAAKMLSEKLGPRLTCFVFSNDPDWAQRNLMLGYETVVVDLNDEKTGHFDMHLMSLCDHNVIANSTFSWWGAWLNANPGKRVVAPRNWFAKEKLNNPDICPDNWVRL